MTATRRPAASSVSPTWRETGRQLRQGLQVFGLASHPWQLASLLAYALPRHGLTPTSAMLGAALTWGDQTALIDGRGRLTYRQLGAATGRLAARLWQNCTIRPGDRVALMTDDDRWALIALGAAGLCGTAT